MNQAAVGWVVQRVREWRSAAGISTRLNTAALVEVVEKIEAAGVPDSLACFVVLGCEWMFRLRDLGGADVERRLFRIEQGLTASSFELEDAWIVTEALSASIRKLMKRHRVLAAEMDMQPPPFGGLFGGEVVVPQVSQVDRTARTPPKPLIATRPGPTPWVAPWIAGLIIEKLLVEGRGQLPRGRKKKCRLR